MKKLYLILILMIGCRAEYTLEKAQDSISVLENAEDILNICRLGDFIKISKNGRVIQRTSTNIDLDLCECEILGDKFLLWDSKNKINIVIFLKTEDSLFSKKVTTIAGSVLDLPEYVETRNHLAVNCPNKYELHDDLILIRHNYGEDTDSSDVVLLRASDASRFDMSGISKYDFVTGTDRLVALESMRCPAPFGTRLRGPRKLTVFNLSTMEVERERQLGSDYSLEGGQLTFAPYKERELETLQFL
jgi:hypothetical protein